jgi:hypothetical protein
VTEGDFQIERREAELGPAGTCWDLLGLTTWPDPAGPLSNTVNKGSTTHVRGVR